jgi:hypothetical protein
VLSLSIDHPLKTSCRMLPCGGQSAVVVLAPFGILLL